MGTFDATPKRYLCNGVDGLDTRITYHIGKARFHSIKTEKNMMPQPKLIDYIRLKHEFGD